ncbi:hypothetical protein Tco_1328254 [Tanacetum coccineum]
MRFIPKHEIVQNYGAILPDTLTNQAMKESEAYKTYYDFATGKVIPKPKYVRRSTREKTDQAPKASPGKRLKATAKVAKSGKKKLPAQGLETLSEIALSEADQMKLITKRSKTQFHSSHASGSGANEGTGVSPGVPDVPTYGSEDEQISWKSSDEDDDDEVSMSKDDDDNADNEDDDDQDDDNEQTESDNDGDDFVHPKFSTHDEEVRQDKEDKEEECSDLRVHTPYHFESTDIKLLEDTHVIITVVSLEVQQQSSSVSSGFISKMLNPNSDTGIDSILNLNIESSSLMDVPVTTNDEIPPSSVTILPPPPIPLIQHLQQTPVSTPTIIPSTSLQNLPTFGSLFKFEDKVKSLEEDFLEFKQTNLFAKAVSSIPGIVDKYLANQMNEAVKAVACSFMLCDLDFEPLSLSLSSIGTKLKPVVHDPIQLGSATISSKRNFHGEVNNPEGQQYLHDLRKPLPLIPNSRGRRLIPFDHFINNDLAYLSGGVSSQTYATSVIKTKAADYGHIKWIEDLVLNTMWINKESSHDVYSRNRIIAIKKLTIIEWHNYKHLDWITIRRDDDKLYTFKEGDYNRLRLQDIEYMLLLLLLQGKLTNLNIEERLALGVSLRMFTRSIVIKRCVEDLQLGIESYQKKLNLTKSDTYRSDLKQKTAYTAYSNPRENPDEVPATDNLERGRQEKSRSYDPGN